ncbi:MAG: putative DNA-binding domain-containing protein [Pseudomonadales bacterium]|nr:putative DNA-binding domain-containing protein [Pseudomonadales bacterium]
MDAAPIRPTKSPLAQTQEDFTRFLRNPTEVAIPKGLDPRRMRVYQGLVYENILSLLSGFFPVIDSLFSEEKWRALIAEFIRDFKAETPYFPKLGEEFIYFLSERKTLEDEPPFLLELAHYESIELALYISKENHATPIAEGFIHNAGLSLSPLATPLSYHYPVHQICANFQPQEPPEKASYLLVFRDNQDEVRFFELPLSSYQLLCQINQNPGLLAKEYLQNLCPENHPEPNGFLQQGMALISTFYDKGVLIQS